MRELIHVPFEFDRDTYLSWIKADRYPDMAREIDDLLEEALPLVRPRVLLREAAVESISGNRVTLGGQTFESAVLRWNLERTDRAWAYLASCGPEIQSRLLGEEDPLKQYWLDALAELAVQKASDYLAARLGGGLSYMNPGSADRDVWDLKDQKPLFDLLENTEEIGVTLTKGYLMDPAKSLSGFYFHSPRGFVPCWVCAQKPCHTRQAAYRADFKKSLGL